MSESFGVVGGDDADPPHVIEFDVCDHIFIVLVFAFSDDSGAPAIDDAAEAGVGSAFLEFAFFDSAVLGGLSEFSMEALLTLFFLRM